MKILTFTPIDASKFNADLGTISAARLLSINYEENRYRWQACDANGMELSAAVFGTIAPDGVDAGEAAAADHIRADIARTLEATP